MITTNKNTTEVPFKFPKQFHMIWVGGQLPEKYLLAMQRFSLVAEANGFKINLWLDNEINILKPLSKILKESILMPKNKKILGIQIRNINEILNQLKGDRNFFQSPVHFNKLIECLDREMIGSKNLASISDILRYLILYFEGGYYADTDTDFELGNIIKLISNKLVPVMESDTALLGFKSAMILGEYVKTAKSTNVNFSGNNDLIASIPRHEILKNTILECLEAYERLDQMTLDDDDKATLDYKIDESATLMDAKRFPNSNIGNSKNSKLGRMHLTLTTTGPGVLLNGSVKHLSKLKPSEHEALSLNLEQIEKYRFKVAGITAKTVCDNTWIENKKNKYFYDTNSMLNHSLISRICQQSSTETKKSKIDLDVILKKSKKEHVSPLFVAARDADEKIVQILLEEKADPNFLRLSDDATPLLMAAMYGRTQTVHELLKSKNIAAKPNICRRDGISPLFCAVRDGNVEMVKALLEAKANTSLERYSDGVTPLMIAAMCGHSKIVQLLLEAKDNPSQCNKYGLSVLLMALQEKYTDIVADLIRAGADPNEQLKSDGLTPLCWAAQYGKAELIDALLRFNHTNPNIPQADGDVPLQLAVKFNQFNSIKALLKSEKTDLNFVNSYGNTALMRAISYEEYDIAKALIDAKSDIHIRNKKDKWQAIHTAASTGHLETINRLIDAKADTNSVNENKLTPLFIAIIKKHKDAVNALLNEGQTNPNSFINDESALFLAINTGRVDIIQSLLEHKANPNLKKIKDGTTPLYIAVQNGHHQAVELLLAAGADPNIILLNESSPTISTADKSEKILPSMLELSVRNGHEEIQKSLILHGAIVAHKTESLALKALQKCCEFKAQNNQELRDHYNEFIDLHLQIKKIEDQYVKFFNNNEKRMQKLKQRLDHLYEQYIKQVPLDEILNQIQSLEKAIENPDPTGSIMYGDRMLFKTTQNPLVINQRDDISSQLKK